MEKLTWNQQDKLDQLCTILDYTGTLDSKDKVNKVLAKFGDWESRYYAISLETIREYVFDYLKKEWTMQYILQADNKYCQLTQKEKRDELGYACYDWKEHIDIDYFDTLAEVTEQAIKDAISEAQFNQIEKEPKQ